MNEETQDQGNAPEPVSPETQAAPAPETGGPAPDASKKIVAGICAILLGSLGVHKFILGYNKEGIIMLLVSILTCGFAAPIIGIIGLVEGIMYLTKSDEEFVSTYITGQKTWF